MRVRLVEPRDAPALRAIYNHWVLHSSVTFDLVARTLEEQEAWIATHRGAYPAVVAEPEPGSPVVGFASLSPYRDRPGYSTTVEDSVYLHPDSRGQGVGRLLLAEVVRLATLGGFHSVMARIVGVQEPSLRLHQSLGFRLVGVEREVGRKFGQWLDVALLQRMLEPPAAGRRP